MGQVSSAALRVAAATVFLTGGCLYADTFGYATAQSSATTSVFGTLDLNTGAFTQIAALNNIFVPDLALSSNGTLYLLTTPITGGGSLEFGTINTTTGVITDISAETANLNSLAFSPGGTLYSTTYDPTTEALYTVDPGTGAATFVSDLGAPLTNTADDIRFFGTTAYTTSYTSPSGLYTLNLSTGSPTFIANTTLPQNNSLAGVIGSNLIAFGATSMGALGTGQLFLVNPTTGATTAGATTDRVYNFVVVPTPEPGSLVLVGAGLALVLRRQLWGSL